MSIGTKIRNLRKAQNLTQVELAKKANISRPYLGDLERDRYNPSVETLRALAEVFGVSVAFFFSDNWKNRAPSQEKKDDALNEINILLSMATPEQQVDALKVLQKLLLEGGHEIRK